MGLTPPPTAPPSASHSASPERARAELAGHRFGRLVVIRQVAKSINHRGRKWECLCDCGKTKTVFTTYLTSGGAKSCGCLQVAAHQERFTSHGQTGTQVHRAWVRIRQRCANPKHQNWADYGGRGILVCDRWLNSFQAFLEDMGHPPPGATIDRIDNNGPYAPENCRWATRKEQCRNLRSNVLLTFRGDTKTLAEWAEVLEMNSATISSRIKKRGWSIERAFTTPVRTEYRRHSP